MRYIIVALLVLVLAPSTAGANELRRLSKKRVITKAEYKYLVKDAAKKHRAKHRDMLYRWGLDIVWEGKKRESSGSTRARNGQYAGMKQFGASWRATPRMKKLAKKEKHYHHRGDWRNCAVCSTRRYVIAVRDSRYSWAKTRSTWPTLERR